MENPKFVHLSLHSAYSLAEGAIHIKDLADWALNNNMPAVALTDSNNLFGALEFSETCKQEGIQPIVGCTLSLVTPYFKAGPQGGRVPGHKIRLLAKDRTGYKNLLKIVSDAHLLATPGDDPHRDLGDLKGLSEGLICLTGGADGPLGALILDGRLVEASTLLDDLAALFPDRLYIEIMRHGTDPEQIPPVRFDGGGPNHAVYTQKS